MDRIGRALSKILRHEVGTKQPCKHIKVREDGFVLLKDVAELQQIQFQLTKLDAQRKYLPVFEEIVRTCNKQRFTLLREGRKVFIRANQGHSIPMVKQDKLLKVWRPEAGSTPVVDGRAAVVHGTYEAAVGEILKSGGLNRMNRTHIHFTTTDVFKGAQSGFRGSCNRLIYVDYEKARQEGFEFWVSSNGVVLCSGDENGSLPTEFILQITDRNGKVCWKPGAQPAQSQAPEQATAQPQSQAANPQSEAKDPLMSLLSPAPKQE